MQGTPKAGLLLSLRCSSERCYRIGLGRAPDFWALGRFNEFGVQLYLYLDEKERMFYNGRKGELT